MDTQTFAGPHPTCREFVAQLQEWGFTKRKEDDVHTVYRGPHGGTLRVLRSGLGRIDPALADKAARLVGVTTTQFWAGAQPLLIPAQNLPTSTTPDRTVGRRTARDTIVALVLSVHAEVDRPLGFDQVVELSGNQVTRAQVRAASATLCRDGHLDRIRSGVYQWSAGERAAQQSPHNHPVDSPALQPPADLPETVSPAELFSRLFPAGVQMTGELFADLEQWARLTGKLAAHRSIPPNAA
jgi:hypothetical protein